MVESDSATESSREGRERFTRDELQDITIEGTDIPLRGSPDEFLTLIGELKGTGTRKVGDVDEAIDEFGSTNLSANIKYGENMGFIERTGEGIILTDEGFELAYAQEDGDDLSGHFRTGLRREEHYLALLLEFEGDGEHQSMIKNSDVLQIMYTDHKLREESETVLKRAVSILFETLELAKYGEVKPASGDYPVRFSFSEEWDADSTLGDLILDPSETEEEEEPSSGEIEADSEDNEADEIQEEPSSVGQNSEGNGEIDTDIDGIHELGDERKIASENGESEDSSTDKNPNRSVKKATINIDIHIDINEMDSAELEKKVEYLNDLLG